MNHFVAFVCLCSLVSAVYGDYEHDFYPTPDDNGARAGAEDKTYWYQEGDQELRDALSMVLNNNVARNVILFLGDGMGVATVTAGRIYTGQKEGNTGEEGLLSFETFPHVGLSKTYNVDHQVPDSAGTGTAYLTAVKTNMGVVGVDARVSRGNCELMTPDTMVDSIAQWSQDAGKRTGVVTSTRITHATPACAFAHSPDRDWECDAKIPADTVLNCPTFKDIARQLVEDQPGSSLNVIMGGGYQYLDGSATDLPGDPVSKYGCIRADGRVLWQDWLDGKLAAGKNADFVRNKTTLNQVDLLNTEYLMGIFANDHVPYEHEKIDLGLDLPTLSEMTEAAITVLDQEPNGFFLLVEGGRIDLSHHSGKALVALDETNAFHAAIQKALDLTDEQETLIVVTADHSHTITISGYPTRGTKISGIASLGSDKLPYTTLSYANGPGYNYTVKNGEVHRNNLLLTNTSTWDYVQQAAVPLSSESHGGEDVAIYASGPMAHLFHSVHEQNYIATVMAYASCVDPAKEHCSAKMTGYKNKKSV